MSQLVLDTNAYTFLCRGRQDVADQLSQCDVVWVPSIVLGELEAGFLKGTRYQQNKHLLDRLLALPCVRVAPADRAVAEAYGRIYVELQKRGEMIPINDVWIAATALANDAALITFDRHFTQIGGLKLILKEV